jgi:hypothetical protein
MLFQLMHSVVLQSSEGGFYWSSHPIYRKSLYHLFIYGTVLLRGEGVWHGRGQVKFNVGHLGVIQAALSNVHRHILQVEGCIIECHPCICPRLQEEEESNGNEVRHRHSHDDLPGSPGGVVLQNIF